METKDIIEKALKGEDYSDLIKEFTPEEVTALNKEIVAKTDEKVQEKKRELAGLTAEKERREKNLPPENKPDVLKQFRDEQVLKAKSKFFSDPNFPLKEEEKIAFEAEFIKMDTGKADADFIIEDMKKAYIALKPEIFIQARERQQEAEKSAADFNANQAGAQNGGGGGDPDKYSEGAKALHKSWTQKGMTGLTLDDAERQISKGENKNSGINLSK